MARIGIATRLTLIIVGALVLLQLLAVASYFVERRHAADGATFAPLLGQIASLTLLLDRTPADDRNLVLRAATGLNFVPSVRAALPQDGTPPSHSHLAEWRLRRLLGQNDDRFIAIWFTRADQSNRHPLTRLRDYVGSQFHAVVGLKSGGYLDVHATGNLAMRLLGLPVGFVAGFLGLIVAVLALFAVRRETKPLTELGAAVEQFGSSLEPQTIKEQGAPDIRALIGAVNAMQQRIVQLMRGRTIVLGAMSHDLRTYLTRLRLRLELLPESEQRSKAAADLDGMQALVDDTLAFARASFAPDANESADLTAIVKKEYETRKLLGENITWTGDDEPLMVTGSTTALRRVVANLVGNAMTYGKVADISLIPGEKSVELRVEDRGPGIAEKDRAQVFEPFFRLETSRNRDSGGAGLGLTIVRQIVESCGGLIAIKDRPGGGACVQVTFPLARGHRPAPPAA